MAIPVIMPRQGQSVESCIITKWHKKPGDKVMTGDMLFSYETDKAAFDEEARADGVLLDIFYNEGDDVPVLVNVCAIGVPGEDISELKPADASVKTDTPAAAGTAGGAEKAAPEPAAEASQAVSTDTGADMTGNNSLTFAGISPRARNKAGILGVNINAVRPTGPSGRIIERDIDIAAGEGKLMTRAAAALASGTAGAPGAAGGAEGLAGTGIGGRLTVEDIRNSMAKVPAGENAGQAQQQAAETGYTEVRLTNIRKVIARAMHNSLATTAQLTLNSSFDATDILGFRKKIKDAQGKSDIANITLNDVILYAVSRTLGAYRDLNAHFLDDRLACFSNVNLAMAVDTERGLMVPVIFKAETKSLNMISAEAKELIESCQKGTVNPDLLKGGSFTVTNLGTLGVESFTPVLNAPQTGILGVNNIVLRPRDNGDGTYSFYPAMGLSLTFDHRALDGAPAARFLRDLGRYLENFTVMLAKQ